MDKSQDNFELDFKDGKIQILRHSLGSQVIFRITFSNKRAPLVITRATHADAFKFWSSIPEGRQNEAEEAGALIFEYCKTFQ